MSYNVVRLKSGQWGVEGDSGQRLGVYRTKKAATRRKNLLLKREQELRRKSRVV